MFWLGASAVLWCSSHAVPVRADLMLYPTRVVMSGRVRSAQLELVNRSVVPQTFRISLVDRRMTESGEIVAVSDEGEDPRSARPLLVYTPRQILLPPGQTQVVRLSLRKPADLPDGEYRSHLQFDRLATVEATDPADLEPAVAGGQVAVALQTLVGASIPVIVRHGVTLATARIDRLQWQSSAETAVATLQFDLQREGTQSIYGDVIVGWQRPGQSLTELARLNGIAVYVPNTLRRVRLELPPFSLESAAEGELRVQFRERPEAGGKLLVDARVPPR